MTEGEGTASGAGDLGGVRDGLGVAQNMSLICRHGKPHVHDSIVTIKVSRNRWRQQQKNTHTRWKKGSTNAH